ncbi:peptidoglycan-binding protein LysM [Ligilactobacillus salitolerans]|uniref:Peptidoglycan-binding protein LysM n=1 Tax=Ligilactobacillus salitolerans TaxID=1808352 RepID=A0A401IVN1_9LACO|nr:LysM domain-containing protein [Ligilactobacillus salitolerans]GBG95613.1 peptidoglycan-binding protein LysM [Ligilactobacillus salitolerans]
MNLKQTLLTVTAAAGLFGFSTVAANADTITVKAGDTISGIAAAHKTSINAIKAANSLSNVNLIFPGQKLEINGTTNAAQTNVQVPAKQAARPVVAQAKVQQTRQAAPAKTVSVQTPAASTTSYTSTTTVSGSEASAKNFISTQESGNSYSASNGRFIGKYQLDASYLNGDYSAANQEKVAQQYVSSRYGSWANAASFWKQNGWY